MVQNSLRRIVDLAQPLDPVECPSDEDWSRVELELGLILPEDYKGLVTAFGSGMFGVGLYILNPVSSSEYARLSGDALRRYRQGVDFLEDKIGIRFFPQPKGLLLVGGIDRQHFLYRPKMDGYAMSSLVYFDHDNEAVKEVDLTLSEFIFDLYCSRVHDQWAKKLRRSVWKDKGIPFFSSNLGASSQDRCAS